MKLFIVVTVAGNGFIVRHIHTQLSSSSTHALIHKPSLLPPFNRVLALRLLDKTHTLTFGPPQPLKKDSE